jgi:hypothetical protein
MGMRTRPLKMRRGIMHKFITSTDWADTYTYLGFGRHATTTSLAWDLVVARQPPPWPPPQLLHTPIPTPQRRSTLQILPKLVDYNTLTLDRELSIKINQTQEDLEASQPEIKALKDLLIL